MNVKRQAVLKIGRKREEGEMGMEPSRVDAEYDPVANEVRPDLPFLLVQ